MDIMMPEMDGYQNDASDPQDRDLRIAADHCVDS